MYSTLYNRVPQKIQNSEFCIWKILIKKSAQKN